GIAGTDQRHVPAGKAHGCLKKGLPQPATAGQQVLGDLRGVARPLRQFGGKRRKLLDHRCDSPDPPTWSRVRDFSAPYTHDTEAECRLLFYVNPKEPQCK